MALPLRNRLLALSLQGRLLGIRSHLVPLKYSNRRVLALAGALVLALAVLGYRTPDSDSGADLPQNAAIEFGPALASYSDAQAEFPSTRARWEELLAVARRSRRRQNVAIKPRDTNRPSLRELEEWKQSIASDVGDTLMELVDECYEMAGIDRMIDSEATLAFEVFGEPGVGTIVGFVQLDENGFEPELVECMRESAHAVRGNAPSMPLKDLWKLTIRQTQGRRVFTWGGEPIVVDGEGLFSMPWL